LMLMPRSLSRVLAGCPFRLTHPGVRRTRQSFADWGEVFNEQVLATAILDRLLPHATTVNIKGDSYRLREKKKAGLLGRKLKATEPEEVGVPG
jgi:hypothetical protein